MTIKKIDFLDYQKYLQARPRNWHKGLSGHVLIIGGDYGMSGAARMAGMAALRVGAGLVSIATRPEFALNIAEWPELMTHAITEAAQLESLLTKADVLIVGPGLGHSDWSKALWQKALETSLPMVIDADGLNWLAKMNHFKDNWILTPHPGEASRLLNEAVATIETDRVAAVTAIAKRYGGVAVLKGAGSLVAGFDEPPQRCAYGNPGMASAGMGDILSGVIGGLLAQRIPLLDAARLGVAMHAKAGDLAAAKGERGIIATDLLPYLHELSNTTTNKQ